MSKQMTPCEKLGYKVGDKFEFVGIGRFKLNTGDFITLSYDDGSECPLFSSASGGAFVFLEKVRKASALKPAKQALADAIHQNGGWADVDYRFVTSNAFGDAFYSTKSPSRHRSLWVNGFISKLAFSSKRKLPNWHQTILSRDEYLTAYPEQKVETKMKSESEMAIKVSDWHKNGELPPVGEVVDVVGDDLMYGQGERNREVIAHVENTAVIRMGYGLGCFASHALAPAKSERDWAIDEIISTAKKIGWNSEMASQIIGEIAVELYEAGYRKEVK